MNVYSFCRKTRVLVIFMLNKLFFLERLHIFFIQPVPLRVTSVNSVFYQLWMEPRWMWEWHVFSWCANFTSSGPITRSVLAESEFVGHLILVFEEIQCFLRSGSGNSHSHWRHLWATSFPNLYQHWSFFILNSSHSNWGCFFSVVSRNFLHTLITRGWTCWSQSVSGASGWRPWHLPHIWLTNSVVGFRGI